jgi:hypothetical protein
MISGKPIDQNYVEKIAGSAFEAEVLNIRTRRLP